MYLKHHCSFAAWSVGAGTWGLALAGVCSGSVTGQVGGWIFLGAKAVTGLITVVSLARRRDIAWRLFAGRYRFDSHGAHGILQVLTRYTWELPQFFLGYCCAQLRNICGRVDRVETLDGVTYAICCHRRDHAYTGMSLGCYVHIWMPTDICTDFPTYARHYAGRLFLHEYGHTFDSQLWGWLYLPVVGVPSLVSQIVELLPFFRHSHATLYAERWANRHASRHFGLKV